LLEELFSFTEKCLMAHFFGALIAYGVRFAQLLNRAGFSSLGCMANF